MARMAASNREPNKIKPLIGKITIQCTYIKRLLWFDAENLLLLDERFDMIMVSTCSVHMCVDYLLAIYWLSARVCASWVAVGHWGLCDFLRRWSPVSRFFPRLLVNSAHSTIRLSPTRFYASPWEKQSSIMEYIEPHMRREPRTMQLNAPLWWRWRWWWRRRRYYWWYFQSIAICVCIKRWSPSNGFINHTTATLSLRVFLAYGRRSFSFGCVSCVSSIE